MSRLIIRLESRETTSRQFEELAKLSVLAMVGTLSFEVIIRSGFDKDIGETIESWDWLDLRSVHNYERLMPSEQADLDEYIMGLIHKEEQRFL